MVFNGIMEGKEGKGRKVGGDGGRAGKGRAANEGKEKEGRGW